MHIVSLNIVLALSAQASYVQDSREDVDNLLDKLIDRFLSAPQANDADFEDTTLGKPGQVAMPAGKSMPSIAVPTLGAQRSYGSSVPKSSRTNFPPGYNQCLQQSWHQSTPISARANQRASSVRTAALGKDEPVVVIGVAADSGCGKSTFMRRLTNVFGGEQVGPLGGGFGNGGWETNTLVSDQTTVICLDDYHLNDRGGRKVSGKTALHTDEQKFDLMAEQLAALKRGEEVKKPIYNHVNGTLDTPETIKPTPIVIIEGLHPFVDERVRDLIDFSIYLDITDDVKFAWKIARDMEERGHSLESIKASIEARKPDFDAYVAPQRANADLVIQVLPTDLANDETGKILKVRFIQATGMKNFDTAYLFDEGSTISWTPCGSKLSCDFPGIQMKYGPDSWFGKEVNVLEMDGQFNKVEELCYIESHLQNLDTKFYGEATQAMIKNKNSPGSQNGSGFFQTLAAFKLRSLYEKISGKKVETPAL
jgi:phosphoribulokinase